MVYYMCTPHVNIFSLIMNFPPANFRCRKTFQRNEIVFLGFEPGFFSLVVLAGSYLEVEEKVVIF